MRTSQEPRRIAPRDASSSSSVGDSGPDIPSADGAALGAGAAARRVQHGRPGAVELRADAGLVRHAVGCGTGWVRNWRAIVLAALRSDRLARVMCWYLRQSDTTLEEKSNAGIVMMLMHAAGIAAFNAWAVPPADRRHHARSRGSRLLILIYAMIAPSTPRRMLIGVARRRVIRSARLLDRLAARGTRARPGIRVRHLLADVCVRVRRGRAGARPAAHRPASARGAGPRQLSAGRAARRGRHGRSVARRASPAGARCGHQAGAARSARRARRERSAG